MKKTLYKVLGISSVIAAAVSFYAIDTQNSPLQASSHREAPMIANDALADNTDLYAFRSPDDPTQVTIIANYVPLQLPQGGPNYASFGENVRYEIHIENGGTVNPLGDDITYRFEFNKVNGDTTTFFNIRLGAENLKTRYVATKSINGGPFTPIVASGTVAPPNIGPRSISGNPVGLSIPNYSTLIANTIYNATGGGNEKVFCGPADDPFFVDLGGVFDLGRTRGGGTGIDRPEDGVACKNIHSIALQIPISTLQKSGLPVSSAANILDGNFVIGVWASASRPTVRTLNNNGTESYNTTWTQVSRIGMPLTNEVIVPIGSKDVWNSKVPYGTLYTAVTGVPMTATNKELAWQENYFCNPELSLYLTNNPFAAAVPALSTSLRTQTASLGAYNFSYYSSTNPTAQGLFPLLSNTLATAGTALATLANGGFGEYLLRANNPRSVDLLPIFHTGVPNLRPYQLATGKPNGSPLAAGKPFINNFLPTFGDMLRLNMAVPVTPRNSPDFNSMGLLHAAVLGLTNPTYSGTTLQNIPNMDGFPNGRRLEDDVTRIELQAVGGIVLAAIGVGYDDFLAPFSYTALATPQLVANLTYSTGIQNNDTTFRAAFPYVQTPWSGFGKCGGPNFVNTVGINEYGVGFATPSAVMLQNYPNPFKGQTTFKFHLTQNAPVTINIYDLAGKKVGTAYSDANKAAGTHEIQYNAAHLASGIYIANFSSGNKVIQSIKISVVN
jgi:hypothetical protein